MKTNQLPPSKRKPPRARRDRKREYLEPSELNKLLDVVREPDVSRHPTRDYLLMLMLFAHAMRIGEALGLTLSEVDLKRKMLFIRREKGGKRGEWPIYDRLKPPFAKQNEAKAIETWLTERNAMEPETDALFVTQQRGPMTRQGVWLMLNRVALAAGLQKLNVHAHQFRHTLGTHLVEKNTNLRVIQDFMSHQRIESTTAYTKFNRRKFAELL